MDKRDHIIAWPPGFSDSVALAASPLMLTGDLAEMHALGGDAPHLNYPLRHIADANLTIQMVGTQDPIGAISRDKALREAYPGATYLHFGRAYRVERWRVTTFERAILVRPVKHPPETRPMLKVEVGASYQSVDVIDRRYLAGAAGSLVETRMRVNESVEGFYLNGAPMRYAALQSQPAFRRQCRTFTTTGVVLQLQLPRFAGAGSGQANARRSLAKTIAGIFARTHGIASQDLLWATSGIAIKEPSGMRKLDNAIAFFDSIPGGLRLTAPLFDELLGLLEALRRGTELAHGDPVITPAIIDDVIRWRECLNGSVMMDEDAITLDGDERLVFAPQSEVQISVRGQTLSRVLMEPQLVPCGGRDIIMYRYESDPGVVALVPHDQVDAHGTNWRYAAWSPSTRQLRELAA